MTAVKARSWAAGHGSGIGKWPNWKAGVADTGLARHTLAVRRHDPQVVLPAEHADSLPSLSVMSGLGEKPR